MKSAFSFACLFILVPFFIIAQEAKEIKFVPDTMTLTGEQKVLQGEYVETTLKNLSVVRLFKTKDNHYYIRFMVTTNFYFDKVDMLEIRSGNKSYYAENTKQFKVSKTIGLFIAEIPKNYIAQLKDEGITSIVFGKAETDFTRQDASQVKKIARYFHESIAPKK
ncbi:MAG: hypothetical protein IT236_10830 [Bacteroidia bacterium]|nr:hypothetical protein [Bacteroidia bacterium]